MYKEAPKAANENKTATIKEAACVNTAYFVMKRLIRTEGVSEGGNSGVLSIAQLMRPVLSSLVRKDEEEEEWLEWRAASSHLFASEMPDYCGVGWSSAKKLVEEKLGTRTKEPMSGYVKQMLKHGHEKEKDAIEYFLQHVKKKNYTRHAYMPTKGALPSRVHEWRNLTIACTPDLLIQKEGHEGMIPVEIKCPANWLNTMDIKTAMHDFTRRTTLGRLNAFVQCMTYACMYYAPEFFVFYYFTDGEQWGGFIYHHRYIEGMETLLLDRAEKINEMIKEKKYKRLPSIKSMLEDYQALSFIGVNYVKPQFDHYIKSPPITAPMIGQEYQGTNVPYS